MSDLGEVGVCARGPQRIVRRTARHFGAQLGRGTDLPAQVRAGDLRVADRGAFLQVAGADLDAVVRELDGSAPPPVICASPPLSTSYSAMMYTGLRSGSRLGTGCLKNSVPFR